MAIQMSSELLDGCVLGLLVHDDYYAMPLLKKFRNPFQFPNRRCIRSFGG